MKRAVAYKHRSFGKITKKPRKQAGLDVYLALLIAALLVVGVLAGAVFANLMDGGSHEAVGSYITGFFDSFDKNAINQKATFIDSFYKYVRIVIAIWAAGFFAPGFIVIVCLLAFKAFAYGFTTAALIKYFGFYGFVIGFCSYIPQNLFFLPAMAITSHSAFMFICGKPIQDEAFVKPSSKKGVAGLLDFSSGSLLRNGKGLPEYFIILIIGVLCCACASLTETYLTPAFIEYIRPV